MPAVEAESANESESERQGPPDARPQRQNSGSPSLGNHAVSNRNAAPEAGALGCRSSLGRRSPVEEAVQSSSDKWVQLCTEQKRASEQS